MCASVLERSNLIASPFTSPLLMPPGWEEEKCSFVVGRGIGGRGET